MATEFELRVLTELSEIKAQGARNQQAIVDQGCLTNTMILAQDKRINGVEETQKWVEKKQWIHSIVVTAISGLGLAIKKITA